MGLLSPMTVSYELQARMNEVARSGSLDQLQSFLRSHPETLNEFFALNLHANYTFLGYACYLGHESIVEYLLSMPHINLSSGYVSYGVVEDYTPLDLALSSNCNNIVHMLVAVQAPLKRLSQQELDEFLGQHPPPQTKPVQPPPQTKPAQPTEDQTWPWMPRVVITEMQQGTLNRISNEEIKRLIHDGLLPCGWTHDPKWKQITTLIEEQETFTASYDSEKTKLEQEETRLTAELNRIQTQLTQVQKKKEQLQEYSPKASSMDWGELKAFAQRVEPIENALMSTLEAELEKKKPQLSALTDVHSTQPKLSLLLNCMGTQHEGIQATRELDRNTFLRQVKNTQQFVKRYTSPKLSHNELKDMLYCGELLRDCETSIAEHEEQCPVCMNSTAEQLLHYLKEIHITLDPDTIKKNNINGRRVLFSLGEEFPDPNAALQALDRLREIHEDAM